jgi:hypothetical protein
MIMQNIKKLFTNLMPQPYGRVWRAWDRVRYDIPNFLRNAWLYRAELTHTYDWDGTGTLKFTKAHLERVADYLETKGHEIEDSRLKKVKMIRRAVELIDLHLEERFTDWAELEMGEKLFDSQIYFERIAGSDLSEMKDRLTPEEKAHNGRIYRRADEIAKETWQELFEILRGQDIRIYSVLKELDGGDHRKQSELWDAWFDGSGLKHWWD